MSEYFGFHPVVALRVDDIPYAMQVSHDVLIQQSGRLRTSGISWEIWGSDLAGVLARTKTGVRVQHDSGRDVSGTLDEGLSQLDKIIAAPGPGESPHDVIHDHEAIQETKRVASAHPDATLVIAYCDVRSPEKTNR